MRWSLLVLVASLAMGRSLVDVEYTQVQGQALRMDGFVPDGAGPFPAAIIVHGGAWVTGDKARSVRPLFQPLADTNFAWFSINYRLARGSNPEALVSLEGLAALTSASDDVRSALAFVRAHAAEWNIDPERVVLIGESAGAHLASMAALQPGQSKPVQGVVAFYSPSDLVNLVETSPRIPDLLRNLIKSSPFAAVLMNGLKQLSPQTWITGDAPPFLMIHGTADALVPVQQSETMCGALQKLGAKCELLEVPGAGHGMNFWEGRSAMTGYKSVMTDWLKALLLPAR